MVETGRKITEKERNILSILNLLIENEKTCATAVADKLTISTPTVSRLFKELKDRDLIIFVGKEQSLKGRSPELYSFNHEYGYIMHIYIAAAEIHGYLADLNCTVLKKLTYDYNESFSLDDFFSIIKDIQIIFKEFIRNKKKKILAAGFSIPGIVDEDNHTIYCNHYIFQLNKIKFLDYAERVLELPVIAHNECRIAAVGEKSEVYPFAESLAYLVFAYPSGIGGGIIIDNKLVRGGMNFAGELGQTWYDNNISLEEYARGNGYLEDSADLNFLVNRVNLLLKENKALILKKLLEEYSPQQLTLCVIEEAALKGDKDVIAAIDELLQVWTKLLVNLNLFVNPEIIVIGGNISVQNRYIYNRLNEFLRKLKKFQPNVQFSISGENAQLRGGLKLLKDYVCKNVIFKEVVN